MPTSGRYPSAGLPAFASLLGVVLGRPPEPPRRGECRDAPRRDPKPATVPFSYMKPPESVDTPPLTAAQDADAVGRSQEEGDGESPARTR